MNWLWRGLLLYFLTGVAVPHVAAMEWGPWSVEAGAPVISSGRAEPSQTEPRTEGVPGRLLIGAVRFFQKFISPVDGTRCTMTPSCSHYSIQAIEAHGPLIGFMMTADRIVHEQEEQKYVPVVRRGTTVRYYDPISNNDFWFPRNATNGQPFESTPKDGK